MKSKANSLTLEDLQRICRNGLIMYTPVILVLLTQVENGSYDYKVPLALVISITIDGLRRYLRELK